MFNYKFLTLNFNQKLNQQNNTLFDFSNARYIFKNIDTIYE